MTLLPIDSHLPEIVARRGRRGRWCWWPRRGRGRRRGCRRRVLRGGLLSREHPNLVMLQPRRVAARASAQRIAEENGWSLGREVGYHVRFDTKVGPDTRLRVLTEGILTRQLLDDPFLEGVGCVLLDEFHERSIHTDLCVALLREVRQTVREDLILIVMSATLEAEPVARFLGGCPIVRTEGRTLPGRDPPRRLVAGRRSPSRRRTRSSISSLCLPSALSTQPSALSTSAATSSSSSPASRKSAGRCPQLERAGGRAGSAAAPAARQPPARGADARAAARETPQGDPRDQHRRDVADDRRRPHRHRQRLRPRGRLRPAARARPPGPPADQQGLGRPAGRPRRADRAGRLRAALVGGGRAGDGRLRAAGNHAAWTCAAPS